MENKLLKQTAIVVGSVLVALAIISILNISYPVSVVTTTKSTELAVVGEGKVEIVPDTAYVDAGINVTSAKTVKEVETTINGVNNKIIETMSVLGVKKEDIKTSNYSIFPDYSYENNTNRIRGYNGNVTITIKVTDTSKVAAVVEGATAAGANQINGVRFTVDKPELYREKAREAAITNAREQAQKIAGSLGIKLGRVTNIIETAPAGDYPVAFAAEKMAMGGGGSPIVEPGTQTITSTVTLYFDKR